MPPSIRTRVVAAVALSTLLSLAVILPAVDTVAVNPALTHQTIEAWGTAEGAFAYSQKDSLRLHLVDEMVNGLGLTRTRIEAQNGNFVNSVSWERYNDNGNSATLDPTRLNTNEFDSHVSLWAVPMKQAVEANGEPFVCYFSPSFYDTGSSGTAPSWLLNNPGEHAEWLTSYLLRLKNVYGITPTYCTILNEAGYHNAWTAAVVGKMIKTVGPRIQAAGLPTKIQFPEGFSPKTAWNAITTLQNDAEVWPYVGMLSYHLYGSPYDPYRSNIRNFGELHGIPRAQTEYTAQTINTLYDDLTQAEVSAWELYYCGSTYLSLSKHWYARKAQYWNVRQITKYVRPGSVRVDATSSASAIRSLAFMKGGKPTVVLLNNSGGAATTVNVTGLVSGSYGVCRTNASSGGYTEVGVFTVPASGVLAGVSLPSNNILTVYPRAANLAPVVTDWKSSAPFLSLPASTTTLSAAAQDPEGDAISFAWSVLSKPSGATVALATPAAASCAASGLTVAGDYVFRVAIKDPTHTILRTVEVTAFTGNQAPVLDDVHNRNPVDLTLPTATSTTLRAAAADLEGDAITYTWTVASAPAGAAVVLATPTANSCVASGMTIAGNYVFTITASDPTHTVSQRLTVPVYPVNTAPVISSISAAPTSIALPTSGTTLSAVASDPDAAAFAPWRAGGDVLTYWWEATSVPAGAKPVFATPGSATTTVSGLTVAGTYTFTFGAMDRAAVTSKTITVTVTAGGGTTAPEIAVSRSGTAIADGGSDSISGLAAGTATVLTYQIANSGTGALTVGTPTLGTRVNCTATVSTVPGASVAAGGTTTLAITVTPKAVGTWSCPVSFVTNDSDENPTNWTAKGTATGVPAPWTAQDLGSPGATGSASFTSSTGVWTIGGAGTGIAGSADACQLVYQMVAGDFDFTARLSALPLTSATAQVGLILREKTTADARVAFVGLLGNGQVAWARRKEANPITQSVKTVTAPPWVRLSRRGNQIKGWYSIDGTTWLAAGTAATMALPDQIQLGMCVASGVSGSVMTTTLQNVALTQPTPAVPSSICINFQPSTSPTLTLGGVTWLAADGAVYGQRWGGLSYGCDVAISTTFNRNSTLSSDERYDTGLNPSTLTRTFSVGLPDGSYQVTVCVGDPNATSGVLAPEVQGVRVVTGTATTAAPWFTGTVIVDVLGGRLTLSNGSGATAVRWAWMQIDPVTVPGGGG